MVLQESVIEKITAFNLKTERIANGELYGPTVTFFTPIYTNARRYGSGLNDTISIDSVFGAIEIEQKMYQNVVKISDVNNELWPPNSSNNYSTTRSILYWAKNIGIVRRINISDSSTKDWKIIHYEIIQ
jgi:hypothetical protein